MEELTIWEQHTITLNKDPKVGFGFALSGGKDKPHPDTRDTAVVVSDVLPNGPAMGRLFNKDQIVMVNGVSMENVHSNYTIQILKSCGKVANVTIKRPRKIQIPATSRPSRAASQSNLLDQDPPRRTRHYSDSSDNRDTNRYLARSATPDYNGHGNTLPLMSSGYKRLPQQDVPSKPIKTTLVKKKTTDEYGLKLGSQIFIKHMTETGLAAKEGTLQEGDLILKINGMTTENLSLLETKHLVEKSRGKLTMTVLRDDRKFLVSIPEVEDSTPNSEDDGRQDTIHNWTSSRPTSSASRPRRPVSESDSDRSTSPPPPRPDARYKYSSDIQTVSFVKEGSVGLRLVGGNDVGIFVGGVQPNSPAYAQGMKEGDQILLVNKADFRHFTREEAANFLLNVKNGEKIEICTQTKIDIYKKIIKSNLGDNFYVRTHFDHEAEGPIGMSFTRGEVFRVVDTMHRGKLGNWLAIRMGNDLHELDKGTIPNQARAETLASIEQAQRATGEKPTSGQRAEFWKLRGLRGNKKNEKSARRTRDDLLQLTIQGKFPAYERVLLREANFKRPIVILGPLNDIAMEKLVREMPDEYEVAEMVSRSNGTESGSTVIKLDTVRRIAEKDKHPLLDITPTAVERLNYIQYHPMVLFLDPHSRKDVKTMRHKYSPNSNKSSRRLYTQALKLRKQYSHLFSGHLPLRFIPYKKFVSIGKTNTAYLSIQLESGGEQDLDALDQTQSDYLSAASDLEDTDGEPYTDGEAYTDNDELEEGYPGQEATRPSGGSRVAGAALARSSEPASEHYSPTMDPEPETDTGSLREIPPLMHVPDPRSLQRVHYSLPHSTEEEDPSQRSFTDSDFDVVAESAPSEGPPDFVAPNPSTRYSVNEPSHSKAQPESPQHPSLSIIEEKLQKVKKMLLSYKGPFLCFYCICAIFLKLRTCTTCT
uniref:Tight junction protein 3 n=1 Tax=Mastacembelus armatus TaxID=205130 RepID=A0A7N8YKK0_9TELE